MPCLNLLWMSKKPNDTHKGIQNKRVEGTLLAQITPVDAHQTYKESFSKYFMLLSKFHNFTPLMAPLVNRSHGFEWFTRKFPTTGDHEAESWEIWENFLTPKLLSTRLWISKYGFKILCYQPNCVSRQFGVSKTVSKSFFSRKNELCLCTVKYSHGQYTQRLDRRVVDRVVLTPFPFQPTFYCTKEFGTWWRAYHVKEFLRL